MMWNQINILIYLSLNAIRFYFAEMSIVIIRKNYFGHDTTARTNYLPYSLLNCENQVVCKKILVIWDYLRWMYWIINCITTVFETKNYITSIIHLEVYPKWYYFWTTIVPIILSVCSPRDLLRESLGYVLH